MEPENREALLRREALTEVAHVFGVDAADWIEHDEGADPCDEGCGRESRWIVTSDDGTEARVYCDEHKPEAAISHAEALRRWLANRTR